MKSNTPIATVDHTTRFGWDLLVPVDLAGPPELKAADAAVAALQAETSALPAVMDAAFESNDADLLVTSNARAIALPLIVRQARQTALRLRVPHLEGQREGLAEVARILALARDGRLAEIKRLHEELSELAGPLAEAGGRYDTLSRARADVEAERKALAAPRRRQTVA